jgi:hypothetical protein
LEKGLLPKNLLLAEKRAFFRTVSLVIPINIVLWNQKNRPPGSSFIFQKKNVAIWFSYCYYKEALFWKANISFVFESFQADNFDHFPTGVKAIRTAGSNADWQLSCLID